MRQYAGFGAAAAGTDKTVLALLSGTTVRPELRYFCIGSSATPADVATLFKLLRLTAVGTEGNGFTPTPLDSGDVAALGDYAAAHSSEPTYTSNSELWQMAVNQRATFQWYAHPDGGIICPATANTGTGLKSSSSGGTPTIQATMHHGE